MPSEQPGSVFPPKCEFVIVSQPIRLTPGADTSLSEASSDVLGLHVVKAYVVEEDVAVGAIVVYRHTAMRRRKGDVIEGEIALAPESMCSWPIAIVAAVPDELPTPVKFNLRTLVSDTFPTVTVAVDAGCTVTSR